MCALDIAYDGVRRNSLYLRGLRLSRLVLYVLYNILINTYLTLRAVTALILVSHNPLAR